MSVQFPPCPTSLKTIQHYLKTAAEHDQRDPVISYWCRLFALQTGLKIDRKSDEAKALLTSIMDWLETQKKELADNEAVTNDIAAQAHIENYALKLFLYADSQDRAANFGKNVVKAFYTAGMLYDVLTTFGELTEEASQNRKYAKWKAAYIHNCLKTGETPVPGPMGGENELEDDDEKAAASGSTPETGSVGNFGAGTSAGGMGFVHPTQPAPAAPSLPPSTLPGASGNVPVVPEFFGNPQPTISAADSRSNVPVTPVADIVQPTLTRSGASVSLNPEQVTKAQKYCKWASSALNYDDVNTAIENLEKALNLLRTGVDVS